jgi:hypothetical protein
MELLDCHDLPAYFTASLNIAIDKYLNPKFIDLFTCIGGILLCLFRIYIIYIRIKKNIFIWNILVRMYFPTFFQKLSIYLQQSILVIIILSLIPLLLVVFLFYLEDLSNIIYITSGNDNNNPNDSGDSNNDGNSNNKPKGNDPKDTK